jgi:hypothetical protein
MNLDINVIYSRRLNEGFVLFILITLITGCSLFESNLESDEFDAEYLENNKERIKNNALSAQMIINAEISSIDASSGVWSGCGVSRQQVNYKVIGVLKGSYSQSNISVNHLLVNNSRHADNDLVCLSPTIFSPGNKLIIFIRQVDNEYEDFDEDYGTIPYSEQNENVLKDMI